MLTWERHENACHLCRVHLYLLDLRVRRGLRSYLDLVHLEVGQNDGLHEGHRQQAFHGCSKNRLHDHERLLAITSYNSRLVEENQNRHGTMQMTYLHHCRCLLAVRRVRHGLQSHLDELRLVLCQMLRVCLSVVPAYLQP